MEETPPRPNPSKEDVSEIQSSTTPPHHFPIKITIVILLLALGGIVSVFAYQTFRPKSTVEEPIIDQPQRIVSPDSENMPDWETYRNEEYGFELKYPSHLTVSPISPRETLSLLGGSSLALQYPEGEFRPQASSINVVVYDRKGQTLREWITANSSTTVFGSEPTKEFHSYNEIGSILLGGIHGIRFIHEAFSFKFEDIAVEQEDHIILFGHVIVVGDLTKEYNQILSTFRFLDEKSNLTKECANEFLKITMHIPNDWTCNSQSQNGNGSINIESDEFKIFMSSFGRGGPCGAGPESENCAPEPFYTSNTVTVQNYFDVNVEGYELFGEVVSDPPGNWISVTPQDTSQKEPSLAGATQLKEVLETIKVL